MRRVATLALITGGTMAAVSAGAFARGRLGGRRGPEAPTSEEDSEYTLYAPGGPYGFMFNGPVGWACTKYMPVLNSKVYRVVAEILDLQPDDELLDIGCGPGAFLATRARLARRVVGLDPSRVMLRAAERRLADRLAAGTAELVLGSSASLPFGDGEFSAITIIEAPANPAEVFRTLRPGGRFVLVDPDPRRTPSERASAWGRRRWDEADFRRMLEDAGFTDLTVHYNGYSFRGAELSFLGAERIVGGRKPAASRPNTAVDVGGQHELTGSATTA